jgi:uncharacterized protein (TIGR03083 family)
LSFVDARAYMAIQDRVTGLVDGGYAHVRIPACPAWTAHDLISHLAGLCEDWVVHRLDHYASQAWTAAQVARFSGCPLDEVLRRWSKATVEFVGLPDDPVMGPPARWALGDAVVHEADLRGALGVERVPSEAVAMALKGQITRWRQVLSGISAPALLLRAPDAREWWLGSPDDPEAVVVEAPAYDLFRALAGRRTSEQVRAWGWTGDPSPYLNAGLPYPYSFATSEILD